MVLLVRRPLNLIGSQSPIELCPYVVDVAMPNLFANGGATLVRPAAHHQVLSRRLLVQMSGTESAATSDHPRWTLIGAGSLGSKMALHLARAGHGPDVVVDRAAMTPHNAARHALMPMVGDKAVLLCESLRDLDQVARPVVADAARALTFRAKESRVCSKDSWAVVNATASLAVHEALAATETLPTRGIETSLFAGGRVGVITVEGPTRNPNTGDLMAEYYAILGKDRALAAVVFDDEDAAMRQIVGQGCGSVTMALTDGRVSLFASAMAEYLLAKQRDGLPSETGELLIGRLSDAGLGLSWTVTAVPPVQVVRSIMHGERWRMHIHARADAAMRKETARCSAVETGGVLMGRISEASRTVHIVDVLDAPDDSVRSPGEFVLGITGLTQQIKTYANAANWSLYCLGIWHSHLSSGGPSSKDRATARAVSLARLTPSVFLIRTPDGYRALLADGGVTRQ